jgi:hypothetical protein
MMREAEMRRQHQQQQQQQLIIAEESLPSSLCDEESSSTTGAITGITGSSGTTRHTTSHGIIMLPKNQQDSGLNQVQHPPDCRCILRKLAREDLFLPQVIKNKGVDEADDKA